MPEWAEWAADFRVWSPGNRSCRSVLERGTMVSPMDPAPRPPAPESNSRLLYAAIGCAVFLVVGLCVATGLGVWWVMETRERLASTPMPFPPPQPPPPGTPGGPVVPGGPVAPGGPQLPPPPGVPMTPRVVSATVTNVTGSAPVAVGATCQFNVERMSRPDMPSGYWCRTQIVCGGRLLYGGPNSGYFPCTVGDSPPSVTGSDADTTASDTDAAINLDTASGILSIRDDSASPNGEYSLDARIDSVR